MKDATHFIEVWSKCSGSCFNDVCRPISQLEAALIEADTYKFYKTIAIFKIKAK